MTTKFFLWACGIVLVAFLSITSYGVVTGLLPWAEYKTIWAGLLGTLLGYCARLLTEAKQ